MALAWSFCVLAGTAKAAIITENWNNNAADGFYPQLVGNEAPQISVSETTSFGLNSQNGGVGPTFQNSDISFSYGGGAHTDNSALVGGDPLVDANVRFTLNLFTGGTAVIDRFIEAGTNEFFDFSTNGPLLGYEFKNVTGDARVLQSSFEEDSFTQDPPVPAPEPSVFVLGVTGVTAWALTQFGVVRRRGGHDGDPATGETSLMHTAKEAKRKNALLVPSGMA